MPIYKKLKELGIVLPPVAPPAAAYLPYVQTGNLLFLSGHIAKKDGKPWTGQLGLELAVDHGAAAARSVAIDLLGTLHAATGELNRIQRIVNLLVLVNITPTFTSHHLVANGASELLIEILGDAGRHARAAFGVAQIPLGCCVEIAMVAELKPAAA